MYIFDVTGVTNPTNLTIKTASGSGFSPDQQKIYFAEKTLGFRVRLILCTLYKGTLDIVLYNYVKQFCSTQKNGYSYCFLVSGLISKPTSGPTLS